MSENSYVGGAAIVALHMRVQEQSKFTSLISNDKYGRFVKEN